MKNTKKILMILCAITLLTAMAFSIAVSAAIGDENVVAGEGTTLEEYLEMKKITSYGFEETGKMRSALGISNPANLDKIPSQYKSIVGQIVTAGLNNAWTDSPEPIYGSDEETANNFYVVNYNYNIGHKADLYIQPILGNLSNIEKTPIYGFVAEFDIAFLSPSIPITEPVFDSEGRTAYYYTETSGEVVVYDNGDGTFITAEGKTAYVDSAKRRVACAGEEEGAYVYVDGTAVADPSSVAIMTSEDVKQYFNILGYEKGEYVGLGSELGIGMYNTVTLKDGKISLLNFDAKEKTIKIKNSGNVIYTFSADEWAHIAIQYDADTMLTYVYVGRDDTEHSDGTTGRKLILTMNAIDRPENTGYQDTLVYPLQFRLGCSAEGGIVAYDNFLSYQGTSIHNPDLVASYSDAERFGYLSEVLKNESGTNTATNSYQAYSYMGEALPEYYDINTGEYTALATNLVKEYVEVYLTYYNNVDGVMDTLKEAVKEENTQMFLYYVNNVTKVARTLDNVLERDTKITAARKYLASVGSFILKNSDYNDAVAVLEEAEGYVTLDENSNSFISYIQLFEQSLNYGASLNRLTTHYENAKAYYELGLADCDQLSATDSAGSQALRAAIDLYEGTGDDLDATSLIAQQTRINNSERFVAITTLMKNNTTGSWQNDNSVIENYWRLALDILIEDNYAASYDGMTDALAVFDSANDYYWAKMQQKHIDELTGKLAEFNESGKSYVEKAAICTYVDQYISINQNYIDEDNLDVAALVATNEAYKVQLGTLEGDYANILVQNTIKFVNIMQYIEYFETYDEIKPLYEEATNYYYSMNIVSDTISEETIAIYIEKYENLRTRISLIETDCELFLAYSETLSSITDEDELYFALSECSSCLENLDETYDGISEAKVVYDAKYAEYTDSANLINEQLSQTVNVVCALRGNWSFDAIVSYFKSLFN